MKSNKVDEFIDNPKKALIRLAVPIIIAMLVQTAYNIVDTIFVGRLGAEAIAALTFSFPLFFVLISINSGIGTGVSSRISRFLGEKNKKQAENTAMHGLIFSFLTALVVFIIGMTTLEPLFHIFGASEDVMPLGISYMRIILMSIFFMFLGYTINSIFQGQGNTKTPMKIQVTALVTNIILDPIFIYVFNFGVNGAAIATLISFFVSFIIFLIILIRRSDLKINFFSFKFSKEITKDIFFVGMPASITMIIMSVYVIFINWFMAYFGTEYVASFGIVFRLESVAIMPIVAVSFSLVTLAGMFYGAKEYEILKKTCLYGIKLSVFFTVIIGIVFFLFPVFFLAIFTPDKALLEIAAALLRIQVFTYPLMAITMNISRIMQGIGKGIPGLIINLIRVVIVAVPLSYVFVFVAGFSYLSISIAMVISAILASIIAVTWLNLSFRNLGV